MDTDEEPKTDQAKVAKFEMKIDAFDYAEQRAKTLEMFTQW